MRFRFRVRSAGSEPRAPRVPPLPPEDEMYDPRPVGRAARAEAEEGVGVGREDEDVSEGLARSEGEFKLWRPGSAMVPTFSVAEEPGSTRPPADLPIVAG